VDIDDLLLARTLVHLIVRRAATGSKRRQQAPAASAGNRWQSVDLDVSGRAQ
jgi:hypothetical protein